MSMRRSHFEREKVFAKIGLFADVAQLVEQLIRNQ